MPTDSEHDKVVLLYRQGRYELATQGLRRILSADPRDPWANGMLALCLSATGELAEAESVARTGVEFAPDMAFPLSALTVVLLRRGRPRDARVTISQAIQIEPENADHLATLAAIELELRRAGDALKAADSALAIDPHNTRALNARGAALIALGRHEEAERSIAKSLAINPEEDTTHDVMGMALLYSGQHESATDRYREALRLDPNSESARIGLTTSLKAQHRWYRILLTYLLWKKRQHRAVRLFIALAPIFALLVISELRALTPTMRLVLTVLIVITLLVTSYADALFNLVLRFHPVLRHSLTLRQRAVSNYAAVAFPVIGLLAIVAFGAPQHGWLLVFILPCMILLPLAVTIAYPPGKQRHWFTKYTIVAGIIGGKALVLRSLGYTDISAAFAIIYALGCSAVLLVRSRKLEASEGERI